ncbi:hypothetical protein A9Q84_19580 [Halobacteriovorax marinus]|uniref:Uncharacterized protein n=1 Tax=Halobacteriovorax marinus TaxID=97084 RepID=A0A1Y5F6I5_9BACT|nr:hypothetical protein A9Q84_19580 [Halobacteriovorax marinus]
MKSLPNLVEIEINSACNRKCSYCPNSISKRVETGDMEEKTFIRIMDQLGEYNYSGKISFEFYNEPLLSRNFLNYTKIARKKLPNAILVLYSNGTKITSKEKFKEIQDAGIDYFYITKHENEEDYKFDEVYKTLSRDDSSFIEYRNFDEIDLYNRGGLLEVITSKEDTSNLPCSIPTNNLTITLKGNVVSCFEDYEQNFVLGNVNETHVIDIWNSLEYKEFRKDLKDGKRHLYENCKDCDRIDKNMKKEIKTNNKHFLGDEELAAIKRVFEKGNTYRYQMEESECAAFEREFSEKLGFEKSIIITSGTNALVAGLLAVGVGPKDEVIIPSYTYIATAAAVLTVGAIPVVVNIKSDMTISLEEISNAITDRTKAIIPVHMDGVQCDIEAIVELAAKNNLSVIEDVAQAMGGKFNGKYLGTFGDIGCFSLNRDKILSCGEGGIVATTRADLREKLLCITDHGYSFNPLHKDEFSTIKPFLGLSMRVSDISGAIMRVQLEKLSKIQEAYRERKEIFLKELSQIGDNFEIIAARDSAGDCCTSIHINCKAPDRAMILSKKLLQHQIYSIPVTLRNAHCVWKWKDMLGAGASSDDRLNPFLNTDKKYSYSKAFFLDSLDILMSTLKIDIDVTKDIDEVRSMARSVALLCEKTE